MARQVIKLLQVLKDQGAYRLRLAADGRQIEWISEDDDERGGETVLTQEPDSSAWERLMLELLAPLTPESLL